MVDITERNLYRHIKAGNLKIGKDTLIFNMNSATDCPSKALGLCAHADKCYALRAEKLRKEVLPYRRRQAILWNKCSTEMWISVLRRKIKNSRTGIKYIRFNESGDFNTWIDVYKLTDIAREVYRTTGVVTYGYTARKCFFLNWEPEPALVVSGSGFMVDNCFTTVPAIDKKVHKIVCPGNCRTCNLCKVSRHKNIFIKLH